MNKRGISPIIATILLIAFAVAIGVMIMNWTTGITEEVASCDNIRTDIINKDSFCKVSNNIVPRVLDQKNNYVACQEYAIDLDTIPTC